MKRIAIIGGGEIGSFIAERLTAEQFDVTLIEKDPQVLATLQNSLDIAGVQGNATNINDLRRAYIEDADLFIATTRQDETNLISCLLSRELNITQNIAVTRYLGSRDKKVQFDSKSLGIDLIVNISEVVKSEIMEVIETTGAAEVATFAGGRIVLIGYQVEPDSPLHAKKIGEISINGEQPLFNVASLVRKNDLVPPSPATVLEAGDYLYLITTNENLPILNRSLKVETIKTRNAVIYGDNYLSQLLAGSLLNRHFHVTMLARNDEKANFLKNYFRNRRHFLVEKGEGIETRLLRRVKVPTTSVFIATTNDDASNLTACLIAKDLGAGKTVATIKGTDVLPLCQQAGVDVNVAPRLSTAKVIQKVVHENRVREYRAVHKTNLEVIEVEAQGRCRATRAPLGKLKLPTSVIIGGIVSNEEPILPSPEIRIRAGDTAIVLTLPEHLMEAERFFRE